MKRLLTLLVAAVVTLAAYPAFATVASTPHDYLGVASRGRCEVCHVPHVASSVTAKRLWRASYALAAETGTWDTGAVGQLCGMCHGMNGAAAWAPVTNAGAVAPHGVGATVYAGTSHGRTMANLGAGAVKDTAANASGRPYINQTYMQCTSCHNVHDDTVRPFLRANGIASATISKVCGDCHDRYSKLIGANNTLATGLNGARSMHPVDVPYADDTNNNANGGITQFQEPPAAMKTDVTGTVATTTANWALGGKFQADLAGTPVTSHGTVKGSGLYIGCQTCHSIHQPVATTDNSQSLYQLAVSNVPALAGAGAGLCESCHGGGNSGIASSQYVGAPMSGAGSKTSAATGSQLLDDHPIDITPDGAPKLEAWNATTRFERLPAGAPVVWPYAVGGTYRPATNNSNLAAGNLGRIVCTSCHSAHNAKANTSLNRSGGAVSWCFSCHLGADTIPGNHHSTKSPGRVDPGNWSTGAGIANSVISCEDCHGTGSGLVLTAHMGFFVITDGASPIANDASQLCNSCHVGGTTDPVGVGIVGGVTGVPDAHLTAGGTKTHYLGVFDINVNNIHVKTGNWMAAVNNGRGASYSKYGGSGTDTHNSLAPTVTASSTMVCESCHAVLYNAGSGTLQGGWQVNLLLQNYEDNDPGSKTGTAVFHGDPAKTVAGERYVQGGVGSGFCVACHNQQKNASGMGSSNGFVPDTVVEDNTIAPANMHPMTNWTITRAVDAGFSGADAHLRTADGTRTTYADATNAPNAGSYDGTDAMSCDGCHRPHQADSNGTWDPSTARIAGTSVILEPSGMASSDYAPLCQQCHKM